jgi:SAM-dependent methyltransferase
LRELPGVDIVASVNALPFDPGTVDEISYAHLLEHFPQEQLLRQLLPRWFKLLKPGGRFRAVVPDGAEMMRTVGAGTLAWADFHEVLFGAQDYDGDSHYNLFTPETAMEILVDAGFTDVAVPVRARRNGKCFEFEIVARKPMQ